MVLDVERNGESSREAVKKRFFLASSQITFTLDRIDCRSTHIPFQFNYMQWITRFWSRRLVARLRKSCSLDSIELDFVGYLPARHISLIIKVAEKLRKPKLSFSGSVDILIRVMVRNEEIPNALLALSGQPMAAAADEILDLQEKAQKGALADREDCMPLLQAMTWHGSEFSKGRNLEARGLWFSKLTFLTFAQVAPMLSSQLPSGCTLLFFPCLQYIEKNLEEGWAANEAAGVFIRGFVANPMGYVHVPSASSSYSSYSSAPRSVGRSECRSR